MLEISEFSKLLEYSPDTGIFRWVVSSRRKQSGSVAGTVNNYNYVKIQVSGKGYLAHRLAWAITTGAWPKNQIDHINGDRSDNRISNLREASNAENCQNKRKRKLTSSKHVGVSWNRNASKWHARIMVKGKQNSIGYFDCEMEAAKAYKRAKSVLHTFNPVFID